MLTKELEMPELLALSYPLLEKKFGFNLTSPQIPVKEQVGVSSGSHGRSGEGCTDTSVLISGLHGYYLMAKMVW